VAVEILLPRVGASGQQGRVTQCFVKDGEKVREGEPLFSITADTSTSQVEAPATGTLKINATVDETYEVGTVLGYIE
jgi:pyruvate/2-oxoglutarate dehydrogenase complex dihydrolipoamide acyltransferase (E2) component